MQLKVQDFHPQPRLVFLHGWGVNSGVFRGLLPQLSAHYAVRFIDLPGFGSNNHIEVQELSFEHYCRMLIPCIPKGAALAGWSMGGLVAQYLASHPECHVQRLVAICSTPSFMQENQWPGIKPHVLEGFQVQLLQNFEKTLDRFLAIQAMGSETAKQDLKTIRQQVHAGGMANHGALAQGLDYLHNVDLRPLLPSKLPKTLRIFGSQDSLVPKASAAQIQRLDPDAIVHIIDKASHAPFISHPRQFLEIFNQFMADF
ncbi:pimeloyl-ACP methyl ester esterase BioH [Planctobacterium marinum]|uniref:pimeloyl-ACP methyl ester esterase BioH n=1 Tax=Planctobacterium marinum TaxID=1631968 RepID=UPI001E444E84|nr:pimeloyl-ACP methyl ester esterase BioH [Planctobacterium marinum]MCC2606468.1 pimeloyl-ACP methyl ester esterase BioH [Planctobacterium marinum]